MILLKAYPMKTKTRKTIKMARRTTAAEREEILKSYYASKLSRREFALQNGIKPLTFHGWFRKSMQRTTSPAVTRREKKFVKVSLPETVSTKTFTVEVAGSINVRIHGLNIAETAELLREVYSC